MHEERQKLNKLSKLGDRGGYTSHTHAFNFNNKELHRVQACSPFNQVVPGSSPGALTINSLT
jgi:hypothetical protein